MNRECNCVHTLVHYDVSSSLAFVKTGNRGRNRLGGQHDLNIKKSQSIIAKEVPVMKISITCHYSEPSSFYPGLHLWRYHLLGHENISSNNPYNRYNDGKDMKYIFNLNYNQIFDLSINFILTGRYFHSSTIMIEEIIFKRFTFVYYVFLI